MAMVTYSATEMAGHRLRNSDHRPGFFDGGGFVDRGTFLLGEAFAVLVARRLLSGAGRGVALGGVMARSPPATWWIFSSSSRSASVSSASSRSMLGRFASSCAGNACTS